MLCELSILTRQGHQEDILQRLCVDKATEWSDFGSIKMKDIGIHYWK